MAVEVYNGLMDRGGFFVKKREDKIDEMLFVFLFLSENIFDWDSEYSVKLGGGNSNV